MMHRINRQALFHHDHFAAGYLMMHKCTRRRFPRLRTVNPLI